MISTSAVFYIEVELGEQVFCADVRFVLVPSEGGVDVVEFEIQSLGDTDGDPLDALLEEVKPGGVMEPLYDLIYKKAADKLWGTPKLLDSVYNDLYEQIRDAKLCANL